MMSVIPAGFLLLGAVLMFFFNIDETFLHKIEFELQERKRTIT
jgi:Na+/melibiose symporter-like transporter